MVRDGDRVAVFNSVHRIMEAEKILKGKKLDVLMIPAPRTITTDCGLALRYPEGICAEVEGALGEAGLLPKELYRKAGEGFERINE
ncbi:DUF3343 domain-containing protein [Geomonas sp. RF6]|uniref:DUF3343 domain-containing protein n=1 Tax=Geomonas sp. RF6 TaxID=2897342 RepID=UPI001E627958|nr:DUF3343 domain-containing protein [Geomonas sp. RF6]UFS72714.1 DUF3343 domain-containing protein [Geomonas sp. RF6]